MQGSLDFNIIMELASGHSRCIADVKLLRTFYYLNLLRAINAYRQIYL